MTVDLNARRDKVFEIIVTSYIDTAEPVGSKTISKISGLGLSSASIRNVMADLEEVGYLTHPHTSAGRVPTDRGYRYYVDSLMEPHELEEKQKLRIRQALQKARSIEALATSLSKLISEMTDNTALVYIKNLKRVSFLNHLIEELVAEHNKLVDLIEEESELFIEGAYRMFDKPEFHDSMRIKSLLHAFEDKINFLNYFFRDGNQDGVHVYIGSEIASDQLEDLSLVSKDCFYGNSPIGGVAVIGPTRLNYSQVVPIVDYVTDVLSEAVKGF